MDPRTTTVEHPNADVLAAFGRGELPATEIAAVADHVAACDTCCGQLRHMPEDTLVLLARDAAASSPPAAAAKPLAHTTPAAQLSDANFAPPGTSFGPRVPNALVDHPRYRILDVLGEGGMGVVFKAEHRMMGRIVALKVLAPHLIATPGALERFVREYRAAGRLNHPNIVTAHDADEAEGLHFLVMEYVEGISLQRLVDRRGPLAVSTACLFARQVALGLQHAHEKGMIHRDIKPQNLVATRKGQVKVLDFGLARFAREADLPAGPVAAPVTVTNMVMGTPDFLSPEQARNSHEVDIRSDLYSLGCTLYFLLTGKAPFASATTLMDKLIAHTEDEAKPVSAFRDDVPDSLTALLAKLMAKRPGDRYATPGEAAASLAPFSKGAEPAVTPATAGATAVPAFEVVEADLTTPRPAPPAFETALAAPAVPERTLVEAPRPKPKKKKRRKTFAARNRKLLAVATVMVAGLVVGVVGRAMMKGRGMTPPGAGQSAGSGSSPVPAPSPAGPPLRGKQILFVLPQYGLWPDDYFPVRKRLEEAGAKAAVATGPSGRSYPEKDQKNPVQAEHNVQPQLDVSPFAAVIFVGKNVNEFVQPGLGSMAARSVIDKAQRQNAVLGAICYGEMVLAVHGALDNRFAATQPQVVEALTFRKLPIRWDKRNVVVDGKVVTASGPEHAVEFADAIVKTIRGE